MKEEIDIKEKTTIRRISKKISPPFFVAAFILSYRVAFAADYVGIDNSSSIAILKAARPAFELLARPEAGYAAAVVLLLILFRLLRRGKNNFS